ncbi:CRISPR-associated protein Csx19 [Actinocorallia sp. API 0066]|uniref:type III-D CRISPR-associated protein Csx19 n=1 Tax=Actinocorallia sp. API 0066 TaxID=2896846 RepID=UPI001E6201FA|nr:CRISPR-associated protein Csx19 [Actinocorallia sp. API 0066]MCD0449399.1 CRISPR-associated protein Csx19 [Actinocorallia sp. API 0066]
MTTLHYAARDDTGLDRVLAEAADGSVALLSTPWRYHVALVRSGAATTRAGEVPLTDVFEARIFNDNAEFRWSQTGPGTGRAVVLTENPSPVAGFGDFADIQTIGTHQTEYLLWGGSLGPTDGWSILATARIGRLEIPGDVPEGGRASLVALEYLAREQEHGNVYVAEERLLRFSRAEPRRPEGA